jgi:hypothetical protein
MLSRSGRERPQCAVSDFGGGRIVAIGAASFQKINSIRDDMPRRSHNSKRRPSERIFRRRQNLCTLVVLLPTYYNPDALGGRKKIEPEKWRVTMAEIERLFSGYQQMHITGWNRADRVKDDLYRFEIDLIVTRAKADAILRWRQTLERRFEQRLIYMRCFEPLFWL